MSEDRERVSVDQTLLRVAGVDAPTEVVERGGGEMRARVNDVQKTLRVQKVVSWLLDGMGREDVISKGIDKWGLSRRQVERYITEAKQQIEAQSATEVRGATTLALYRLTQLYYEAVAAGDLKVALDVVKTQNRMLGLNAPEKFETKAITDWNSMSVAEQLEHIGGILQRAGGVDSRDVN